MIQTPQKIQDASKHARRRYEWRHGYRSDASLIRSGYFKRRQHFECASYWFCCLDFRLLIAFWIVYVSRERRFFGSGLTSDKCTCFICTDTKRKWWGNSKARMSRQELRIDADAGDME